MDGFINLYKPAKFTSNDALNIVRRYFRGEKIGHGGTLDPDATGVLPVCIGKGTKLQDRMIIGDKSYRAEIVFGKDSDTLDVSGVVTITDKSFTPDLQKLKQVLADFIGEQEQVPPMVSAIKIDGVPLYKLARQGRTLDLKTRLINIKSIDFEGINIHDGFVYMIIKVNCSKGTYIRSLARDIGAAMGTTAIISKLERLRAGSFTVENSITLEQLKTMAEVGDYSFVISLKTALKNIPGIKLDTVIQWQCALNGKSIPVPKGTDMKDNSEVALYDSLDEVIGIGLVSESVIKIKTVLWSIKGSNRKKHNTDKYNVSKKKYAIAIGNFDGVHLGHRFLLEHCIHHGLSLGLPAQIITFNPHTSSYDNIEFKTIKTRTEKLMQLKQYPVENVSELEFTEELRTMSPDDFISEVLVKRYNPGVIYVGEDFSFGYMGKGNVDTLKEAGAEYGFEVVGIPRQSYNNTDISSTAIRGYLENGNFKIVNSMLGYSYRLKGEVVYGNQLGRTMNFPTANIDLNSDIVLPKSGSYIGMANYRNMIKPAVCCIGSRPSVSSGERINLEIHILNEDVDLYGEEISCDFIKFIRPQQKFGNLNELREGIASDVAVACLFFKISLF